MVKHACTPQYSSKILEGYFCRLCNNKSFKTEIDLILHIKSDHNGIVRQVDSETISDHTYMDRCDALVVSEPKNIEKQKSDGDERKSPPSESIKRERDNESDGLRSSKRPRICPTVAEDIIEILDSDSDDQERVENVRNNVEHTKNSVAQEATENSFESKSNNHPAEPLEDVNVQENAPEDSIEESRKSQDIDNTGSLAEVPSPANESNEELDQTLETSFDHEKRGHDRKCGTISRERTPERKSMRVMRRLNSTIDGQNREMDKVTSKTLESKSMRLMRRFNSIIDGQNRVMDRTSESESMRVMRRLNSTFDGPNRDKNITEAFSKNIRNSDTFLRERTPERRSMRVMRRLNSTIDGPNKVTATKEADKAKRNLRHESEDESYESDWSDFIGRRRITSRRLPKRGGAKKNNGFYNESGGDESTEIDENESSRDESLEELNHGDSSTESESDEKFLRGKNKKFIYRMNRSYDLKKKVDELINGTIPEKNLFVVTTSLSSHEKCDNANGESNLNDKNSKTAPTNLENNIEPNLNEQNSKSAPTNLEKEMNKNVENNNESNLNVRNSKAPPTNLEKATNKNVDNQISKNSKTISINEDIIEILDSDTEGSDNDCFITSQTPPNNVSKLNASPNLNGKEVKESPENLFNSNEKIIDTTVDGAGKDVKSSKVTQEAKKDETVSIKNAPEIVKNSKNSPEVKNDENDLLIVKYMHSIATQTDSDQPNKQIIRIPSEITLLPRNVIKTFSHMKSSETNSTGTQSEISSNQLQKIVQKSPNKCSKEAQKTLTLLTKPKCWSDVEKIKTSNDVKAFSDTNSISSESSSNFVQITDNFIEDLIPARLFEKGLTRSKRPKTELSSSVKVTQEGNESLTVTITKSGNNFKNSTSKSIEVVNVNKPLLDRENMPVIPIPYKSIKIICSTCYKMYDYSNINILFHQTTGDGTNNPFSSCGHTTFNEFIVYKCTNEECNAFFSNKKLYFKHYVDEHGATSADVLNHLNHTMNSIEQECLYCLKHLKNRTSLQVHITLSHFQNLVETKKAIPEPVKLVKHHQCTKCPAIEFTNINAMMEHAVYKHYPNRICQQCEKIFRTSQALVEHFCSNAKHSSLHKEKLRYECPKCPTGSDDLTTVQLHNRFHLEKAYTCDCCSCPPFKKLSELYRHRALFHKKIGPTDIYECSFCDYGSVFGDKIMKHMIRCHNGHIFP